MINPFLKHIQNGNKHIESQKKSKQPSIDSFYKIRKTAREQFFSNHHQQNQTEFKDCWLQEQSYFLDIVFLHRLQR